MTVAAKLAKQILTVIVFVMRHGEKGGPNDFAYLTEKGKQQVRDSAERWLKDVDFDAFYSSEMFRASQTAIEVCSVLPKQNNGLPVRIRKGFGYKGTPGLENYPAYSTEVNRLAEERGCPVTVALWHEVAPEMIDSLRDRFTSELLRQAERIAQSTGKDESYVFIASHSPTSEMACTRREETSLLPEAGIIRYVIEVKFIGGVISGSKVAASEVLLS